MEADAGCRRLPAPRVGERLAHHPGVQPEQIGTLFRAGGDGDGAADLAALAPGAQQGFGRDDAARIEFVDRLIEERELLLIERAFHAGARSGFRHGAHHRMPRFE